MEHVQVEKSHYDFGRYAFEGRFVSYYWQLREVLGLKPQSILEVGVGDKVFGNFVKNNTAVSYQSVDLDLRLQPDHVGSITALPLADKSVDVACAFEVLEHIPFEQVEQAVAELARVARTHVVVSVPHFGPMFFLLLKIPLFPELRAKLKLPFPKTHAFNGQHYWELGKRGYPARRLRALLCAHGTVVREFVPFNSAYHHFFVLKLHA